MFNVHLENNALLIQSEGLHQSALQLSLEAFGEVNVQTAKHYGNLGRLYQSMTKYSVSLVEFIPPFRFLFII